MPSDRSRVVRPVVEDLQRIFQTRLLAIVMYGWRQHALVPTLALVTELSLDDLNACAEVVERWHRQGAATPLLLTRRDFEQSLDAFPVEYGEIIDQHEVLVGADPFEGLSIAHEDLRRACEVQAKSHVLHLREDYMESAGHHGEIDGLVRESAPGFAALLRQLARLDGAPVEHSADLVAYASTRLHLDARVCGDLLAISDPDAATSIDAIRLFPDYLRTMEQLADYVDRWRAS